jgi:hypothetical protein
MTMATLNLFLKLPDTDKERMGPIEYLDAWPAAAALPLLKGARRMATAGSRFDRMD